MADIKKGSLTKKIGAGLVAAAAVAAAGYFFYGSKNAKKNREQSAKLAGEMKKKIQREVEQLRKLDPKDFAKVVDTVSGTYAKSKKAVTKIVKKVR
jgi:NAD(P)H-hydrate repair Nnr-like enzyme with NAD(P)H-hydrate epimerase domain